jgi:hypothetical protein
VTRCATPTQEIPALSQIRSPLKLSGVLVAVGCLSAVTLAGPPAVAQSSAEPDWSGGSDYPKLVPGKRAKFAFKFAGKGVTDFQAVLDGKSRHFRLLARTIKPAAKKEAGKLTWHLGRLDSWSRFKHLSFQVRVSKHARVGETACVRLHFYPTRAGTDPNGRQFGKICSKVQRRL